jgi:hypothetical protein
LIRQYLLDNNADNDNELVITSAYPVPVAIRNGEIIALNQLYNTHDEADVIILHQLAYLAASGAMNICIICDDTDVSVLLIHFYCTEKLECGVTMESPSAGRCVVDIKATASKHKNITEYLLSFML